MSRAVLFVAALAALACAPTSSDDATGGLDAAEADTATSDVNPAPGACRAPAEPGPYLVGFRARDLHDPQRQEELTVRVHHPGLSAGQDAAPDSGGAPYPLVILSHGFLMRPQTYDYLAAHLASHGFVVLAVPHQDTAARVVARFAEACADIPKPQQWGRLSEAVRGALEQDHAHRRVADVSTLIDAAEAPTTLDPALEGLIDAERVAVMGHSFGAFTGLMAAGAALHTDYIAGHCVEDATVADILALGIMPFLTCQVFARTDPARLVDPIRLREPRVDALVAMASPSHVLWGADQAGLRELEVPAMLVYTTTDEAVPYEVGPAQIADDLPEGAAFLSFNGGDHGNFGHIEHAFFDEIMAPLPTGCAYRAFVDLMVGDPDQPVELPEATQHAFAASAAAGFLQQELRGADCAAWLTSEAFSALDEAFITFDSN
jgi:predicted dienelactone hydrolase